MKFKTATNNATRQLIRSRAQRTAKGVTYFFTREGAYLMTHMRDASFRDILCEIKIPESRPELIARKCRLQINTRDALDEIELRYLLNILRIEANAS